MAPLYGCRQRPEEPPPCEGGSAAGWHRTSPELRSLLLDYDEGGNLIFAGAAGSGVCLTAGRELAERLCQFERDTPPFVAVPRAYQRGARWVDPRLVAEVTFTTWTTDDLLRHPSFEGLREDKPAKDVKLERVNQKA